MRSAESRHHFDGLAIDREGNVCAADLQQSGIIAVTSDGYVATKLTVPEHDPSVTNIRFGVPGLRTAVITSSAWARLHASNWHCSCLALNCFHFGQNLTMADLSAADPAVPGRDHHRRVRAVARAPRNHQGATALALGALGVVYGDIGTSPLYALQTVFTIDKGRIHPTSADVLGIISLVFWSITIVVSVKYVGVVMRADNSGEGGVLALAALARRALGQRTTKAVAAVTLGVFGACLFYGDSIITPAISVLSSIEGLKVPYPSIKDFVVPLAAVILTALFAVQAKGTHRVGLLFGPVMAVWFTVIAVIGIPQIAARPKVLAGLSPTYAVAFVVGHPGLAFVAMGAVVLAITGAEALYADMGHFGRAPISRAWFGLVFPALTLNYLGQGALILRHPADVSNPFFLALPHWAELPLVGLATVATVIASQAVISGAYSVTRQAVQLGYLPPVSIRQTSEESEGQIYIPAVNWALFAGVLALMLIFRSSARLATAYGVAVTGTFVITTCLLLVVARVRWHWPTWRLVVAGTVFGGLELTFLAGNAVKIVDGAWLPLAVAVALFVVMTTWQKGRLRVTASRVVQEGSLVDFIERVHTNPVWRVPGTAVYPHPNAETTPLAIRAAVDHQGVLHEHLVIVSAHARNIPHVTLDDQIHVDDLGHADDGIIHIEFHYGFFDAPDIPAMLARAVTTQPLVRGVEFADVSYFVSRADLHRSSAPGMANWRKRLFIALAHNAADPADVFHLPSEQTVMVGSRIDV